MEVAQKMDESCNLLKNQGAFQNFGGKNVLNQCLLPKDSSQPSDIMFINEESFFHKFLKSWSDFKGGFADQEKRENKIIFNVNVRFFEKDAREFNKRN